MLDAISDTTALLGRTPGVLRALLVGVPAAWTDTPDAPSDGWRPREVVGHLISAEIDDWIPRAERILQDGTIKPFDPFDRFAHEERDRDVPLDQLVERCAELDSRKAALNGNGIGFAGEIFLHSEFVRSILAREDVVGLISAIAGGDLWISMDQAVTKHPGAGIFRWHQDNGYNQLKREHFQLWVALTETRLQNGALKLVPGSHKRGLLPHSFKGVGQMECDEQVGEHVTVDADAGDVGFAVG